MVGDGATDLEVWGSLLVIDCLIEVYLYKFGLFNAIFSLTIIHFIFYYKLLKVNMAVKERMKLYL